MSTPSKLEKLEQQYAAEVVKVGADDDLLKRLERGIRGLKGVTESTGVQLKVVDVHVLIKSQDLQSEYNATTGWIRFKDLEEAMNIKVLKYALSTSDIAPSTEDYKEAAGFKALPSHTTSLWLIAKREGDQPWFLKLLKPDFS